MRRVLTFLAASLALSSAIPALAQAPDQFKDMDKTHWAYEATESLRAKNILWGYPDQYFRGRRTLTRYEFAVALDRVVKNIMGKEGPAGPAGQAGSPGSQGEAGTAGPQGPAGITPEELATFRRLANEFREELASLGNNMNAVNAKLDKLTKDVADLKAAFDKAPKIGGGVFFGARSDRDDGGYVDRDGRPFGISPFGVGVPVFSAHLWLFISLC